MMDKPVSQMLVDLDNSIGQTLSSMRNIFQHLDRLGTLFDDYRGDNPTTTDPITALDDKVASIRDDQKDQSAPPSTKGSEPGATTFVECAYDQDQDDVESRNILSLEDELTVVCAVDTAQQSRDTLGQSLAPTTTELEVACGDLVLVPPTNFSSSDPSSYQLAVAPWLKGIVLDIQPDHGGGLEYRVKPLNAGESLGTEPHWYPANLIVPAKIGLTNGLAPFVLPVGARVVAKHPLLPTGTLTACTVLEQPVVANKHRYLLMFDDWLVKYTTRPDGPDFYDREVRPVLSCLPTLTGPGRLVRGQDGGSAVAGIRTNVRHFVRSYLESYPERAMVRLRVGQVVNIRHDNGWLPARVESVDASLARFAPVEKSATPTAPVIGNDGWLYRGSYRLEPLFKEIRHTRRITHKTHRPRHSHVALNKRASGPYIEYDYIPNPSLERDLVEEAAPKNYTSTDSANIFSSLSNYCSLAPASAAPPQPPRPPTTAPEAGPFECEASTCRAALLAAESRAATVYWNVNYYCDLARPILCGWERSVVDDRALYTSPCKVHPGTVLADPQTLLAYLGALGSGLAVDYFAFEGAVDVSLTPLSSFPCYVAGTPAHSHLVFGDISDGTERFPLPCVNELYGDVSLPEPFTYDTCRLAAPGVNLILDPGFLTCCDCADALCADSSACACQNLTASSIKEKEGRGKEPSPHGYEYKRVSRPLVSGIFECNDKCPCDKNRCVNRVAQRGFGGARLQVYKDRHKGWCVRTLDDIPEGAFVSIYAGYILTEEMSEAFGIAAHDADEYFAELDFIECAEDDDEEADDSDYSYTSPSSNEESFQENNGSEKRVCRKNKMTPTSNVDDNIFATLQRCTSAFYAGVEAKASGESPKGPAKNNMTRQFCTDQTGIFILDAKHRGNVGRFYSHSCDANMFVQNVFVDSHNLCFPWIAFFASRYISAQTELTWDYMYEVNSTDKMIVCKCFSSNCRGRLL